ncbi:MAG: hypothetical protein ACREOQ_17690, partial [Gemmatimonadales bacterium]
MTATAPSRGKKSRLGRPCTVCAHPRCQEIDAALVEGGSDRQVAAKVRGITHDAIRRHRDSHLPAHLAKAAEGKDVAKAGNTLQQFDRVLERVNLLFDACDRWLRDPEDPTRYEIGPRAENVQVTYEDEDERGKPIRRKARLSVLLKRVRGVAPGVELVETK